MHRSARLVTAIIVIFLVTTTFVFSAIAGGSIARAQEGSTEVTVRARLTGWVARRDGYHLYPEDATVRSSVVVWPNLHGETMRARLEWRRAGSRWDLLDVSSTRLNLDSRGLFLVRGLPAGYSFRIRVRVAPGNGHPAGRSRWGYFRVV
ncbi:MAG: hypothetical protein WEE66_06900 [Actinomycetota bacterium]